MANFLTSIRIICGLLIPVFPAFSKWYYILYLLGGFTDAIDGTVARRLGSASSFGAKLDTAADFIFSLAVFAKLVSAVYLPPWLLLWTGLIIAVKLANIGIGFVRHKTFAAVHSVMNKICGGLVYTVPLFIGGAYAWQAKALGIIFVCLFATAAAINESITILKSGSKE